MADWLDDPVPTVTKTFTKYGYGAKATTGTGKSVISTSSSFVSFGSVNEPLVSVSSTASEISISNSSSDQSLTKSLPLQSKNVNVSHSSDGKKKVTNTALSKRTIPENKNEGTNRSSTSTSTIIKVNDNTTTENTKTTITTYGKRGTHKPIESVTVSNDTVTSSVAATEKKTKPKGELAKPVNSSLPPESLQPTNTNNGTNNHNKTIIPSSSSSTLPVTVTTQLHPGPSFRNRIEFDDEVLTPTSSNQSNRSKTNSLKLAIENNASFLFPLFVFSGMGITNPLSLNKSLESGYGEKKRPLLKAKIAQTIRDQTTTTVTKTIVDSTTEGTVALNTVQDPSNVQISPSPSSNHTVSSVPTKTSKEGKKAVGFACVASPSIESTSSSNGSNATPTTTVSLKSSSEDDFDDDDEQESSVTFANPERERTSLAMRDAFRRVSMAPDIVHDRFSLLPDGANYPNGGRTSIGRLSISMGRLSIAPHALATNRPSSMGMSRMSILQPRMSIVPNQGLTSLPTTRRATIGRMSIAPLAFRARESIVPSFADSESTSSSSNRGSHRRTNVGFLSMKQILVEDDENEKDENNNNKNDGSETMNDTGHHETNRSAYLLSPPSEPTVKVGSSETLLDNPPNPSYRPSIGTVSSSSSSSVSTVCRKFGPPSRVSIHSTASSIPFSGSSSVASPESVSAPVATVPKPRTSLYPYRSISIVEEDDVDEDAMIPVTNDNTHEETNDYGTATYAETPSVDPVTEGFSVMLAGILEYLPSKDLLLNVPQVCSAWHAQSAHVYSWRIASTMTEQYGKPKKASKRTAKNTSSVTMDPPLTTWQPFLRAFPWGSFLSDGAYKSVFRVWNAQLKRIEAISVMDIRAIAKTGNLPIIAAEIQAGCLLSHLIRTGVCPNFVQTYQVFVSAYSPMVHFPSLWGAPDSGNDDDTVNKQLCPFDTAHIASITVAEAIVSKYSLPSTKPNKKGGHGTSTVESSFLSDPLLNRAQSILTRFTKVPSKAPSIALKNGISSAYQFIRMELCRGGDIEGYLRRIESIIQKVESSNALTTQPVGSRAHSKLSTASGFSVEVYNSYVSKLDLIAAQNARSMAFQMIYSLFTARERLYFRHYDIKLLNFFAKPATDEVIETESSPSLIASSSDELLNKLTSSVHTVRLRYGLGTDLYDLPLRTFAYTHQETLPEEDAWINQSGMPVNEQQAFKQYSDLFRAGYVIKLADYGTADTVPATINTPVKSYHFTTLENLPPEYFILGDEALAGYPTDTWALGLCLLHLLWGACPYEEVMVNVSCPPVLRKLLLRIWTNETSTGPNASSPKYSVLASVINNDEECGKIFADTLYRYCVLLWSNSSLFVNTVAYSFESNPVWKLLYAVCADSQFTDQVIADVTGSTESSTGSAGTRSKGKKGDTKKPSGVASVSVCTVKEIQSLRKVFEQDKQIYSLYTGTHPLLQRARRRAERIPGFMDLSVRMLVWSPEYRITMRDSLLHSSFVPFRKLDTFGDDEDETDDTTNGKNEMKENGILTLPFIYYSREEEAEEALPLV